MSCKIGPLLLSKRNFSARHLAFPTVTLSHTPLQVRAINSWDTADWSASQQLTTGGKIPDAFTATVPIWCAVVNRLVARCRGSDAPAAWRDVHLPPWLSASESAQVRARLQDKAPGLQWSWCAACGELRPLLRGRRLAAIKSEHESREPKLVIAPRERLRGRRRP